MQQLEERINNQILGGKGLTALRHKRFFASGNVEVCKACTGGSALIMFLVPAPSNLLPPDSSQIFLPAEKCTSCSAFNEGLLEV